MRKALSADEARALVSEIVNGSGAGSYGGFAIPPPPPAVWLRAHLLSRLEIVDADLTWIYLGLPRRLPWQKQTQRMAFSDCTFRKVDFGHVSFDRLLFTNCSFEECTFADGSIRASSFEHCVMRSCMIRDVGFVRCTIVAHRFENCAAQSVYFDDCVIRSSSVSGRWDRVSMKGGELTDVDLSDAMPREWAFWRPSATAVRLPMSPASFFVRGSTYRQLLREAANDLRPEGLRSLERITESTLPDVMSADRSFLEYPADSDMGDITATERSRLQDLLYGHRLARLDG